MHQATRDNQTTRAEVNVDGRSSLAERKRKRQRELRKDPAYVERERERRRERYQTDPVYAERIRERERERQRERYQTDPAYAERKRENERKRYLTDLAYAEGQKIYKKIYQRIKIQTSNKEEAKEQAVIARARYLQSFHSANEVV
ncbi:hypothetical protein [Endozoicomonas sp. ALE010]|uniref:hypothetical protein n=1 Tax=Endozoicomonas sp. ALE010 TaxID=3403081 RepID=UPI003BB75A14